MGRYLSTWVVKCLGVTGGIGESSWLGNGMIGGEELKIERGIEGKLILILNFLDIKSQI
ncbi:hypothetical protein PSM36_3253 [Proteiniphilum saccharofermentans]|uniref:Uncharacterized protein n=1 Tax=Proteiniphilum saccharofermentans TaxID=1642647 RepID=A0A1R3T7I0_9BACT|nr:MULTISPECIES: hypothetical protein [Proteiniphilum]MDY9918041.1 hypothetical protein [Proteiniphilum sp.]SCD22039.1 hypothetical protein PSM36_3253 [Proteiniphilum saccharofermentans]